LCHRVNSLEFVNNTLYHHLVINFCFKFDVAEFLRSIVYTFLLYFLLQLRIMNKVFHNCDFENEIAEFNVAIRKQKMFRERKN